MRNKNEEDELVDVDDAVQGGADHALAIEDIAAAIHGGDDPHVAETRLLAIENTFGGRVMPLSWMAEATELARTHGLGTHLDGARVFNAAVAGNVDVLHVVAKNPGGDYVAVLTNTAQDTKSITVKLGESSVKVDLAPDSITTLAWS